MVNGPEEHPHEKERSDPCPMLLCKGNVTAKPDAQQPKWTRYECDTCGWKITSTSET